MLGRGTLTFSSDEFVVSIGFFMSSVFVDLDAQRHFLVEGFGSGGEILDQVMLPRWMVA